MPTGLRSDVYVSERYSQCMSVLCSSSGDLAIMSAAIKRLNEARLLEMTTSLRTS